MIHLLAHDTLELSHKICFVDKLPITVRQRNYAYKRLIQLGVIKRYGHATLKVYDKYGRLKRIGEGYNSVVDAGKGELADLMIGAVINTLNAINVGTDGSATTQSMTDLVAAATPVARQAIPSGGRFRSNLLITCSVLIPTSAYTRPVTVREIGLYFDPLATGKMFARAPITAVTLNTGDSGRTDYEIQL